MGNQVCLLKCMDFLSGMQAYSTKRAASMHGSQAKSQEIDELRCWWNRRNMFVRMEMGQLELSAAMHDSKRKERLRFIMHTSINT